MCMYLVGFGNAAITSIVQHSHWYYLHGKQSQRYYLRGKHSYRYYLHGTEFPFPFFISPPTIYFPPDIYFLYGGSILAPWRALTLFHPTCVSYGLYDQF